MLPVAGTAHVLLPTVDSPGSLAWPILSASKLTAALGAARLLGLAGGAVGRQPAAGLHVGRQHTACDTARFPVEQPHRPLQVHPALMVRFPRKT